jgi:prevent-host-death family protein
VKDMSASEFKARCLAVLDEVERTGEGVVIRKRGRAVARLVTAAASEDEVPQDSLVGSVEFLGDVVGPVLPEDAWESNRAPR